MYWCYLLVVIAACVHGAPTALQSLKGQLEDLKQETETIKKENVQLESDLQELQGKIDKKIHEFDEKDKVIRDKTALLLNSLHKLAFKSETLEEEIEAKEKSHKFLKFVNKTVQFAFKISKEDISVLQDRQSAGYETECFKLVEDVALYHKQQSALTGPVKLSSKTGESTPAVILISVKIDLARHELDAAKSERARLHSLIAKRLALLNSDDAHWKKQLEKSSAAKQSTEAQKQKLEIIVKEQEKKIEKLNEAIAELKEELYARRAEWGPMMEQLDVKFKEAKQCYKDITGKATALLNQL